MMRNKYFKYHSMDYYTDFTKEQILSTINPYDWNTIIPWLKILNYPAIKKYYLMSLKLKEEQNKNPKLAFGHYLARMNLASFRSFGFGDLEDLDI